MNLIPRRKRKLLEGEEDMDEDEEDKDGFLLDDQNEPTPIQANEEAYEDYSDPNWIPAANDAEPSESSSILSHNLQSPLNQSLLHSVPGTQACRYH